MRAVRRDVLAGVQMLRLCMRTMAFAVAAVTSACSSHINNAPCEPQIAQPAVGGGDLGFTPQHATVFVSSAPSAQCVSCAITLNVLMTEAANGCPTDWGTNPNHDALDGMWIGAVVQSGVPAFVGTYPVLPCPGCAPIPGGDSAGTAGLNGSFIAKVQIPHGADYVSGPEGMGPSDASYSYASGTIVITSFVENTSASGSYDAQFADGTHVSGDFAGVMRSLMINQSMSLDRVRPPP